MQKWGRDHDNEQQSESFKVFPKCRRTKSAEPNPNSVLPADWRYQEHTISLSSNLQGVLLYVGKPSLLLGCRQAKDLSSSIHLPLPYHHQQ